MRKIAISYNRFIIIISKRAFLIVFVFIVYLYIKGLVSLGQIVENMHSRHLRNRAYYDSRKASFNTYTAGVKYFLKLL